MKKILGAIILLLITIFSINSVSAQTIPVKLTTANKITTCDTHLQEGDTISLVTTDDIFVNSKLLIKKGTEANGLITHIVNNDFASVPASIYAEQFKTKDVNGNILPLQGIVYKSGRSHWMFNQFIPVVFVFIRGGEAFIIPDKDFFTLHLETKND